MYLSQFNFLVEQPTPIIYYLYKITNIINNKIYIGVHRTSNINDGYAGSGKLLRNAYKKHGFTAFTKEILEYFDSDENMYLREAEIVTIDFIKRDDNYNISIGGQGWTYNSRMAKYANDPEFIKRQKINARKGGLKGGARTAERLRNEPALYRQYQIDASRMGNAGRDSVHARLKTDPEFLERQRTNSKNALCKGRKIFQNKLKTDNEYAAQFAKKCSKSASDTIWMYNPTTFKNFRIKTAQISTEKQRGLLIGRIWKKIDGIYIGKIKVS